MSMSNFCNSSSNSCALLTNSPEPLFVINNVII
uniref:Uncharacterized protein n=2 Tax=unclassified Caudoviricetes TaxID=2788787 RepID=A0A8S5M9B9_9CAUD|nr:MAG TPA: hypothetical protein [Siphoviridae sp. ctPi453]DAD78752.1 MAG TPA: hypothetical protein [Siphoviridae sp. ctH2C26]